MLNTLLAVVGLLFVACASLGVVLTLGRERMRGQAAIELQRQYTREKEIAAMEKASALQASAIEKQTNGDLLHAAKVANAYGFMVVRPDEVPTVAMRQGCVVIQPDAWEQLLAAIRMRTNITGEVDKHLRKAGFDPRPTPPRYSDSDGD